MTFCSTHSYTSYFYEIFATCYYAKCYNDGIILYTRSEARFARLLLDCELSYCFHWVIAVVGGRVHEWYKKGSGIKDHTL